MARSHPPLRSSHRELDMTKRITDFISRWTFENVNVEHYEPSDEIINPLVEKLVSDAGGEDISVDDLKDAAGSPRDIVIEALGERMSEEQDRWLDKNP